MELVHSLKHLITLKMPQNLKTGEGLEFDYENWGTRLTFYCPQHTKNWKQSVTSKRFEMEEFVNGGGSPTNKLMKTHVYELIDEVENSTGSKFRFDNEMWMKSGEKLASSSMVKSQRFDRERRMSYMGTIHLLFIKGTSPNLQVYHPSCGHY